MSSPVDSSAIDNLLGQTIQSLDQLRGRPAEGDGESEPVEGVGEGADGLVRAVAVTGGQLAELYLDPSVFHMSPGTIAEEIVVAVNAAFADLQEQVVGAAGTPNLEALASQLKEVQEESNRSMSTFMSALTDAQARIASQGRS